MKLGGGILQSPKITDYPTHTSLVSILCSAATIAGAFSYFASSLFYKRDAWLRLLGTLSSQDGNA